MKYGLAKKIDVYNFETNKRDTIIARPSAWHEAALWGANHKGEADEAVSGVESTYTWAYFAIKQAGKLDEYGLPGKLDRKAILSMMDTMTVYMEDLEDGDLPLAK